MERTKVPKDIQIASLADIWKKDILINITLNSEMIINGMKMIMERTRVPKDIQIPSLADI